MILYRVHVEWPDVQYTAYTTRHPEAAIKEAWCPDHGCPQAVRVAIERIEEEEEDAT